MLSLALDWPQRVRNYLLFNGKIQKQGFKNSPNMFGEALACDLQKFPAKNLGCMLLQYADDLLLGYPKAVGCTKGTDALLQHLEDCGYKVSKRKVQICRQKIVAVPQLLGAVVIQAVHETTHLGQESLEKLLGPYFYISHLSALTKTGTVMHYVSAAQPYGAAPFEDLQVAFTEMHQCGGHKYLLVLVYIHSVWVEAFLTRTEKAYKVTHVILRDLIPRFGLPLCIRSDNRPAFVADLVQKTAMALGITWKLHAAYQLQSSRKVEWMNQTINNSLEKMCQETGLKWVQAHPLVLFKIRCTPSKKTGYSPYEVLYRRPPPILRALLGTPQEWGEIELG
ncbi:Gag-Pol polyprotein [Plecturocebus cupreus]